MTTFRGHLIELNQNDEYVWSDNGQPVRSTWNQRPCGNCGLPNTEEGHDGCISQLPNVINACCGHGNVAEAYVQFDDGTELREAEAVEWMKSMAPSFGTDNGGVEQ